MRKKLNLMLLCLLSITSMYAQADEKNGAYSIKGQVVDSLTNETVPFATLSILLESNPADPVKMLACDTDGRFQTTLNSPGNYVIHMQSVGKNPSQKTFTVAESKKSQDLGTLYMTEDQQRLSEVTITAQKPLVKVEIDKLTYSLEDDPESQTSSTLDMLRKVPMVTVDGEDKIQLKGTSNFKIYLNGKPSNMLSSDNASDVLKSMPASSVKNIEVITDPGAKYDAEGVGGIINIITTKALQGYTGNVRAGVSALGRYNAGGHLSTKVGKFGFTGNYNYNYHRNPWNDSEMVRENFSQDGSLINKVTQAGENKYKGPFQYGSLEASYEIDSLNLLTLGGNIHRGKSDEQGRLSILEQMVGYSDIHLNRYSLSKYNYGSMDMNLDYQHSTHKPDELLTISYRLSHSPSDNDGLIKESSLANNSYSVMRNINDAYTNEHTVQVDYTTPTWENQTLEAGVKYIMRQSKSQTDRQLANDSIPDYISIVDANSDFKHTQHIYSVYLGYAFKLKSWGFKAGVRGEGTALDVKFVHEPTMDFDKNFYDIVPNATVSYQINMAQQIRLGYNMRIYRPGIWHLNPYIDMTDPRNVFYGNPMLVSEKSHGVNLNYSLFTQKFNMNASVSYRLVNNAIQRYSMINEAEGGRMETTFGNMGRNQTIGMFFYGRWNPIPLFNVYVNGGMDYIDLDAKVNNLANSGFSGRVYGGGQLNLPKDFRVDLNGGYFMPWINLQSKWSNQYFTSVTLNKDFLDKKLTVSLMAQSPFWKTMKFDYTTTDEYFISKNTNHFHRRDFRLTVTYRFGTMKDSIKKVKRGISNDDMKNGESGGGGNMGG